MSERARRRTHSTRYKRDIPAEDEPCDGAGIGALLRQEALYTSVISVWCEQREKAALEALGKPLGPGAGRSGSAGGRPAAEGE